MKSEPLHRWLTLGANVGVLLGILLVTLELRQSLTAVRAQTRHEVSAEFTDFMKLLASNEQLANLRRRGDAGELVDANEIYRYEAYTRGLFRYWEDVHYQFRHGLYDEPEFSRQREAWRLHALSSPGLIAWWCQHRGEFSAEFSLEYDGLLPGKGCERP